MKLLPALGSLTVILGSLSACGPGPMTDKEVSQGAYNLAHINSCVDQGMVHPNDASVIQFTFGANLSERDLNRAKELNGGQLPKARSSKGDCDYFYEVTDKRVQAFEASMKAEQERKASQPVVVQQTPIYTPSYTNCTSSPGAGTFCVTY
jgi:hypothetical protein